MSEQQTKEEERKRGWERMMTWRIHIQPQPSRIEESNQRIDCLYGWCIYMCIYETRSATEYDDYDAVFFFCMWMDDAVYNFS